MSLFKSLACLITTVCVSNVAFSASVEDVNQEVRNAQSKNALIQSQIDQLYHNESEVDREFRALSIELAAVDTYNQKLVQRIDQQAENLQSLQRQLASVAIIDREILPLMNNMLRSLENFITADFPFLLEQRQESLQRLKIDMSDIELTISTKYQKLLQAYVTENNYSQTMESYQGQVLVAGVNRQVNFLRLGRAALYFQKLDASQSARYVIATSQWENLNGSASKDLTKAIKMASGLGVPQLINFSMGALIND